MNAFYQTCLTFTSQNVGAGQLKRSGKILFICEMFVILTGFLLGYGVYLNGETFLRIYSDDADVIAAGMIRLYYVCRIYFLCGIMDVFVGSLRGMGSSVLPMVVSLLGACAFRLVWIATYFQTHHSIESLYISYPYSWILTASVHFLTILLVYFRLKRKIRNETKGAV